MKKEVIKNRQGQKVVVLVEEVLNQKGLALVMHGLGGFKEQAHIKTIADAFKENGYTVVRFDTTNTFGESDGKYEDATTTNYYKDLEDVIKWASEQDWYQEPFCLVGHSLGGICTALYAQRYPEKVEALAPISTVISGKLSLEIPKYKNWQEMKKSGWIISQSTTQPGLIKKLKWQHIQDRLKYDLLPAANKLTMPVLMIVGDQDESTPLKHQKILYDKIAGQKELHVIKNAPHTFREKNHLKEVKEIFDNWIRNLTP